MNGCRQLEKGVDLEGARRKEEPRHSLETESRGGSRERKVTQGHALEEYQGAQMRKMKKTARVEPEDRRCWFAGVQKGGFG